MQTRARKGGQLGANGEWYEGGKFLNTTPANPKKEGSRPRSRNLRRVEIEPGVWEMEVEGKASIFRNFVGILGRMVEGKLVVTAQDVTLAYVGKSREQAQQLADSYNNGERWFAR